MKWNGTSHMKRIPLVLFPLLFLMGCFSFHQKNFIKIPYIMAFSYECARGLSFVPCLIYKSQTKFGTQHTVVRMSLCIFKKPSLMYCFIMRNLCELRSYVAKIIYIKVLTCKTGMALGIWWYIIQPNTYNTCMIRVSWSFD